MDVYIILGYLAGGKTTLVKNLVSIFDNQKIALIINDFGDHNTDESLLEYQNVLSASVTGGSIFCSCKNYEFYDKLLWAFQQSPDVVIVEASGLANPTGLENIVDFLRSKGKDIALKGIITVADCSKFLTYAASVHMLKSQVAYADLILVNKCDLCAREKIDMTVSEIKKINPRAALKVTSYSAVSLEDLTTLTHQKPKDVNDILDIHVQKAELIFCRAVSKARLSEICQAISPYCDRIKGAAVLSEGNFIFEYTDGALKLYCKAEGKNFMTVLSAGAYNLKKKLHERLKEFAEDIIIHD